MVSLVLLFNGHLEYQTISGKKKTSILHQLRVKEVIVTQRRTTSLTLFSLKLKKILFSLPSAALLLSSCLLEIQFKLSKLDPIVSVDIGKQDVRVRGITVLCMACLLFDGRGILRPITPIP